jgi:GNAT superfamily N-acetyltransferase
MAPTDPEALRVRRLARPELDLLVAWAAAEGWNPGLTDADTFWAADPEGFVGAFDDGGEMVGSGSIVSYDGHFGFIGFFIVRPDLRGRGLGRWLWPRLVAATRERLHPGATIGIDGVFAVQDFYAASGFRLVHRDLRMRGIGAAAPADPGLRALAELELRDVAAFDRLHFGVDRGPFLRRWIEPPGGNALGLVEDGGLRAIGVVRPCREGFKIGPLFAADVATAERIFTGLAATAVGAPIFLDVPEVNDEALALADRHGMREVFGCARMYLGDPPPIPWQRVFGVTSFELG